MRHARLGSLAAAAITATPFPSSGMLYWLDAASGVSGSSWTSKDPTGMVFNAPASLSVTGSAINSLPAINLAGNHLSHTLAPAIALTSATIISVVQATTTAYARLCGFAPAGGNDDLIGGFAPQLAYSSTTSIASYSGRAGENWRATLAQPAGYYIFETRATTDTALRNRTHTAAGTVSSTVEATGLNSLTAINTLVVGVVWASGAPVTGYRWGKNLAEQIVWTRALSDSEITDTIAALRNKYAL